MTFFFRLLRVCSRHLLYTLLPAALLSLFTGCAATSCSWCSKTVEEPAVKEVHAYWDNHVQVTTNTQNASAPLPGVAGRIWLQGSDPKQMLDAAGKVKIELYDMTPGPKGVHPTKLVDVVYDAETLKRFKRKDMIGDGYTLFVPWETYRPEVKQIKLQVYYAPEKGPVQYATPTVVTLRSAESPLIQGGQQVITPANFQPQAKN